MKTTIRKMFHQIGNKHNGINIIAGYLNALFADKDGLDNEKIKKIRRGFSDIEKKISEADESCEMLKRFIYKMSDPDKEVDMK